MSRAMPGNPLTDPNWAASTADTIERWVTLIREKTTDNIVRVTRGVVFGLIAAIGGLVALVLTLIVLTRALQALLDVVVDHDTAVWASYLVLAGILFATGAFSMAKRHTPSDG